MQARLGIGILGLFIGILVGTSIGVVFGGDGYNGRYIFGPLGFIIGFLLGGEGKLKEFGEGCLGLVILVALAGWAIFYFYLLPKEEAENAERQERQQQVKEQRAEEAEKRRIEELSECSRYFEMPTYELDKYQRQIKDSCQRKRAYKEFPFDKKANSENTDANGSNYFEELPAQCDKLRFRGPPYTSSEQRTLRLCKAQETK